MLVQLTFFVLRDPPSVCWDLLALKGSSDWSQFLRQYSSIFSVPLSLPWEKLKAEVFQLLVLCLIRGNSYGDCQPKPPPLFSLTPSGYSIQCLLSILRHAKQVSPLGSPGKSWGIGHTACLFFSPSRIWDLGGGEGVALIVGHCAGGRDYGKRVSWISLLVLMWLVLHSPSVQEPLTSFWISHKWGMFTNYYWIGVFMG